MTAEHLVESATAFLSESPRNTVSEEDAIREDLVGLRIFDDPLFAFGDAEDPLFLKLRSPRAVHPDVMLPKDWIPDAKTVVSYFCPFTKTVREANKRSMTEAVDEWLHARIEGQRMVNLLGQHIRGLLIEDGCDAVYPATDKRFRMPAPFASNWSERHVAHICGLGTFSLSKGLITKKGIAGRFGSVVTSCAFSPTEREYESRYAYCSLCGACQRNCPVDAIDIERGLDFGKDHPTCKGFLDSTTRPPQGKSGTTRYGCGKCQVKVPCESGIPPRGKRG